MPCLFVVCKRRHEPSTVAKLHLGNLVILRKLFRAAMASHFSSELPWGFAVGHSLGGYLNRFGGLPGVNIGSQGEAKSDGDRVI